MKKTKNIIKTIAFVMCIALLMTTINLPSLSFEAEAASATQVEESLGEAPQMCAAVAQEEDAELLGDSAEVIPINPSPTGIVFICKHVWENGKCTKCKKECTHKYDSFGECTICGYECTHESYDDDGKCNKCRIDKSSVHQHNWENGQCTECSKVCSHLSYIDGKCKKCGKECAHESYEGGYCKVCRMACTHPKHNSYGKCGVCDVTVGHNYSDGSCTVCGIECQHVVWNNGKCWQCNKECSHPSSDSDGKCTVCLECVHPSWDNGKCSKCGYECSHPSWRNGKCTVCGECFEPLTFTSEENGSRLSFSWVSGNDVQYRSDGQNWSDYTAGTKLTLNKGDKVSFRGHNVTTDNFNHFTIRGRIAATGDVTSLTNGIGGDATLSSNCYSCMFVDCSSLTSAPELPATTLATNCYSYMFAWCSSLTSAPELPATTLANSCYKSMFDNCIHLKVEETSSAKEATWVFNLADNYTAPDSFGVDMIHNTAGPETNVSLDKMYKVTGAAHEYENGKCKMCNKTCAHPSYADGKCAECGKACPHASYANGKCTVCGKSEHEPDKVDQISLTLSSGLIGVNFYFSSLDQYAGTGAYVLLNDKKYEISRVEAGSPYVYTAYINAKEMGDKIKVALYDKDNKLIELGNEDATNGILYYSAYDYMQNVSSGDTKELVAAMKNYGLCAQYYFGYNAPASLPDIATVSNYADYMVAPTGTLPTGVKYAGSSLILNSSTTVRHYFSVDADAEVTFTVDNLAIEPEKAGKLCYIDVTDINAVGLSKAHVLVVSDGKSTYTMSYSALTYCGKVKESSKDATLKTLVDSLYWYNSAAKTYFENN